MKSSKNVPGESAFRKLFNKVAEKVESKDLNPFSNGYGAPRWWKRGSAEEIKIGRAHV